ncbi:MAG: saccharopine dehydrogenase, partial [Anaerolineae bacterium]|nr:saccharopine dehydrogenase [Anaerolineae bacterium]
MCIRDSPWGDLATAYRSTGIPDIETYMALPGPGRVGLRFAGLFANPLGKRLLLKLVQLFPEGPDDAQCATGYSLLWGEVTDRASNRAAARMRTPHAYTLTALAALAVVERVLAGDVHPGYQTPATAYGPDFALTIPGVSRVDLP